MTKALGTLLIVLVCIMIIPVAFGIIGGIFGIVFGGIGAVFGVVFGIIGSIFGAVFGIFDWAFDDLFGWHHFQFFDNNNFVTLTIIAVVIAIAIKSRNDKRSTR